MGENIFQASRGDSSERLLEGMKKAQEDVAMELKVEQDVANSDVKSSQEEAVNPFASRFAARNKSKTTNRDRIQKMFKTLDKPEKKLLPIELIRDSADQFQQRNPEMRSNVLILLREYIREGDTKEDILRKLDEYYKDPTLADEALNFLLSTTDGELKAVILEAKNEFNQRYGREITAGTNIASLALEASQKGLGTPTSLRDMYRDITGNPRDSNTLFDELSKKYKYQDLKKVIDFLLHSMGRDLKSKGPSIDPGLLHRLFSETRSLQAILGVYRFFRGRMNLVETLFREAQLPIPKELTFEQFAKVFITLAEERYPVAAKVDQMAPRLGVENSTESKIIAFSQLRDAVREVSLNQIYKSVQHRDELLKAIIEELEELEDIFEDEQGQQEVAPQKETETPKNLEKT